ncbi:type III-A CRISPR-associated RAMP protein Csm3 [Streptococcus fryi]
MTYSKVKITADLVLLSGLHIGTSNAFAAIGATDAPVIKDPITKHPIIPGSSLKGKMRTLLSRALSNKPVSIVDDAPVIKRLFGDSKESQYKIGRLVFRDAYLTNADDLEKLGARSMTEVKFENTIDRITAEAKPRQIERAIRQSRFSLEIIYDIREDAEEQVEEDLRALYQGLQLLELDYLGGSGSRGYGKIKFEGLSLETVFGQFDVEEVKQIFHQEV